MNKYIQDKLLEKHICRFNDGECNCDCYIAGMTDYHNHIVEKVKERFESGEYEMEDGFSYENGIDLSEIPNELFIEFKGIKKGMLGITNYIKKDLIKLLNNI